jgi:hypothetical protein
MRRIWIAAAVYALSAALFTWPLVLHLTTLFGASDPSGDPSLYLWTLGWDLKTLSTHPLWLMSGRIFDANIFFPATGTLAYSDPLLLQALFLWPVYAATHDLVLCYNVLLLASLVASALAMHVLARSLVSSEPAAYVAGLVFGFAPYHFTHLNHIQLQALYFLPLSFFFLQRMFLAARRADTIALGVVMGLQAISSVYYGIIGGVGIACAAIVLALVEQRLRDWRLLRRGLAAMAVALLVALPWSIPYLRVAREAAAGRNLSEAAHGSASLVSYLQAPPTNLLYGRTEWLRPGPGQWLSRQDGPEQALFPGFSVMLLAVCGAVAGWRASRKTVVVYTIVGGLGVVLSLGPDGIRWLYGGLYDLLPGMQAIRAPARFTVLALCAGAVLAALGVDVLRRRFARAAPIVTACALLAICVEFASGAVPFPQPPALSSEAGAWLAAQPGSGAVICLPMGFETVNTPCMLQSLEHGRPIVNGYSGVRPPFYAAIVESMSRTPEVESLLALRDLRAEYIVSDRPIVAPPQFADVLVERAQFSTQRVYQVMWSPEAASMLTVAASGAPPPEPGPANFAVGESATYRVRWTSGPLAAQAGQATISVAPPKAAEAFRFAVAATTAAWVSQFYQVDAKLETTASSRLLPLEHLETIVESGRHIDRRHQYDGTSGQVHLTTGGAAVTLPLAMDARDPITALFYVRTLPLATGSSFSFPLTNNGLATRVDLTVGPLETITLDGRAWSTWKVEPRIRQRVARRSAPVITAWLSADAHHIPVLIEVAAQFGTVRVELAGYRAG